MIDLNILWDFFFIRYIAKTVTIFNRILFRAKKTKGKKNHLSTTIEYFSINYWKFCMYSWFGNNSNSKGNNMLKWWDYLSFFFFFQKAFVFRFDAKVKVTQPCLNLCNPIDYTSHGIFQARTLVSSQSFPSPRDIPTQELNPGLSLYRWIFYQLRHKGSPRILKWEPIPSPADLPNPGIEPRSPALQEDALPTKLSGKPRALYYYYYF